MMVLGLALACVFWCRDPKVTLLEDSNEMQQNLPFLGGEFHTKAEIPEASHYINSIREEDESEAIVPLTRVMNQSPDGSDLLFL